MRKKMQNRNLLISVVVLLVGVGSTVVFTLAYLLDSTQKVENTFRAPIIETNIEEDFNHITKDNITATNDETSDVDVYVRLKFVIQTLEAVIGANGEAEQNEDGTYKTGEIIATPDSFDQDGDLLNKPINIINSLDVEGLNVDFTGSDNADWFTDANQETGIYFYKYSLAPGESAYDLVTGIKQEVFYEDTIIRLTVLVDSVQVEGVEDAWENVNQSGNSESAADGEVVVACLDANGNPILYLANYVDGASGKPPVSSVDSTFVRRFSDNYDVTQGKKSNGESLVNISTLSSTTE